MVKMMGAGWNLGNSFDSFGMSEGRISGECGWGNPKTSKEMIHTLAKAGFGTIRVPITWYEHVSSAPEYTIDAEWMTRIKEVLKDILDEGMYAIINMHHENNWLIPNGFCYEEIREKYIKIWYQIAESMKEWDEHLIFESMNEPQIAGGENEWNGGTHAEQKLVNDLQKEFVEIVRKTGVKNANRLLLVTTVGASAAEAAVRALDVPNDDMVAVSIHPYVPSLFCFDHGDAKSQVYWTNEGSQAIAETFERLDRVFVQKGIPVVITEYGAENKEIPGTTHGNEDEVISWHREFNKYASRFGISCVWWDNNQFGKEDEAFGLFNRNDLSWYRPKLKDEILSIKS